MDFFRVGKSLRTRERSFWLGSWALQRRVHDSLFNFACPPGFNPAALCREGHINTGVALPVEVFAEAGEGGFGGLVAGERGLIVPIAGLLDVFAHACPVLVGLTEGIHCVSVSCLCRALVPAEGFDVIP